MKISVIIPTYKRENDLLECLSSILIQSFFPAEVFVVDNARDAKTKDAVMAKKEKFESRGIKLEYFENSKENSLTSARNLGSKLSEGDIVSFLDDDVILDKDYFLEINVFFEQNKNALGVCGQSFGNLYERNKIKFFIAQAIGKLFLLGFNEKGKCRVLPSMGVTAHICQNIISAEWLGGASSSYKKIIFNEFYFDENLKKYSWSEDIDFSYRIYKKYRGTLFFNPKVKYLHKLSKAGRTVGKERAFMEEIYSLYLFYKLIPQNLKNKIIYLWSRVGSIVYKLLKGRFVDIYFALLAFLFCFKNLKNIKKGDLDFFNNTLK
mgnify:CR=1 FL=1